MVELNIRKVNNMAQVKRKGANVTKPAGSCSKIADPVARAACLKRAKRSRVIGQGTPNRLRNPMGMKKKQY